MFRPSEGVSYMNRSTAGFGAIGWGVGSDTLVPGDYDGDGKDDVAVYRGGTWYINPSTAGISIVNLGIGTDRPIPTAYRP